MEGDMEGDMDDGGASSDGSAGSLKIEEDEELLAATEAPACPAGGVIIFDYRLFHRGLPNTGTRDRLISYGVCSTGWAQDTANYPDLHMQRTAELLSALGPSERRRVRRAYRSAFPAWDEERNAPVWESQSEAEAAASFLAGQAADKRMKQS